MPNLYIERIPRTPGADQEPARLPVKSTTHAANYDVFADIKHRNVVCFTCSNLKFGIMECEEITLNGGDRAIIPTGFKMCSDIGWKIELYPRSGNSIKRGLTLCNSVAQIDADFRHEMMILITNTSDTPITIGHNERIAQLAIEQVHEVHMIEGPLPKIKSNRNGGIGSSGK